MKRSLLFLVAISLLVILAGCGDSSGVTNAGTDGAMTAAGGLTSDGSLANTSTAGAPVAVVPTANAPTTGDEPATGDISAVGDAPTIGDTPATNESATDTPAAGNPAVEVPGTGDVPTGASPTGEPTTNDSSASNPAANEPADNFISVTADMTKLKAGFSAVRYDGDYAFDSFLEQGGAGSDQDVLRFLTSTLLQANAGLEMGGNPFGCSTLSVKNAAGGYFFGRNFDWQTCDALVVTAYPQNGYASISTVNLNFIRQGAGLAASMLSGKALTVAALYAPLDGMNEKGLCVSVNMIQDGSTIHQDTGKPDITTTTAIRLMLDKAAGVEEALELLRQYDLHASMDYMIHFAIADSNGNSVAVEYVDNEMIVTKTPILTNFYLAEGKKQGVGTQQSHTRFDILKQTLEDHPSMTAAEVRDALDSVSKHNFGEFESTEWSIVFDSSNLTATYYHRENYETAYAFRLSGR